jgi:hypothetical protein
MTNALKVITKHYDELFDELLACDDVSDNLDELVIELRTRDNGLTIRRSWRDRDKWLAEQERV